MYRINLRGKRAVVVGGTSKNRVRDGSGGANR
jgi:hypothetical protein